MRWTIGFALFVLASATASAQVLFSCSSTSRPPELTATVNGSAPVVVQLKYATFIPNTTTPVVSRNGNVIDIFSENHHPPLQIDVPYECITAGAGRRSARRHLRGAVARRVFLRLRAEP